MTLLSILITLLLDQFSELHKEHRALHHYDTRVDKLLARNNGPWLRGASGLLVLVGLPALLAYGAMSLLGSFLFGLGGLLIGIAVLYLAIGPLAVLRELDAYLDARAAGDAESQNDRARRLLGEQPPVSPAARDRAVLRAALVGISEQLVAVLLWFALLGPAGAVLYRLTAQIASRGSALHHGHGELVQAAAQLRGVLDWLPVRMVGFGYALIGNFERGFAELSDKQPLPAGGPRDWQDDGRQRLADTGLAALDVDPDARDEQLDDKLLRAGRRLIARSLWLNLGALGLLTMLGWVR
jgi:AmpE protein